MGPLPLSPNTIRFFRWEVGLIHSQRHQQVASMISAVMKYFHAADGWHSIFFYKNACQDEDAPCQNVTAYFRKRKCDIVRGYCRDHKICTVLLYPLRRNETRKELSIVVEANWHVVTNKDGSIVVHWLYFRRLCCGALAVIVLAGCLPTTGIVVDTCLERWGVYIDV